MDLYDSGPETMQHILQVRKNIDIILETLNGKNNLSENTLVSYLNLICQKESFLVSDELLLKILENTYNCYGKDISLLLVNKVLNKRALLHDKSKLLPPEKDGFDEYTPKLHDCTYGSEEYKSFLRGLQNILNHHYANNSHHPEHYSNGIYGMNIFDVTEMFCDWTAACKRHADGNIYSSLDINQKRFGYTDGFKLVLKNTADKYFYE